MRGKHLAKHQCAEYTTTAGHVVSKITKIENERPTDAKPKPGLDEQAFQALWLATGRGVNYASRKSANVAPSAKTLVARIEENYFSAR